jgi:hypothetical protein
MSFSREVIMVQAPVWLGIYMKYFLIAFQNKNASKIHGANNKYPIKITNHNLTLPAFTTI